MTHHLFVLADASQRQKNRFFKEQRIEKPDVYLRDISLIKVNYVLAAAWKI